VDDQLKARLEKYLDALEKGAQKAGEFAEVEIPQAIKEWLWWYGIEHAIYALCFLAGIVVVGVVCHSLLRKSRAWAPTSTWDKEVRGNCVGAAWTGRVLLPLLLSIGLVHHLMEVIKVVVSPRVVLIEKVADVIKGKK
jgi:hypothetical protein